MIKVKCPGCRKTIKGGDDWAGREAVCPGCGAPVKLPQAPLAVESAPDMPDYNIHKYQFPIAATQLVASAAKTPIQTSDDIQHTAADEYKDCPFCGEKILRRAVKCRYCNEFLDARAESASPAQQIVPAPSAPTSVHYDRQSDTFSGTMALVVKLAMRAVQELGWTLDQANENVGLVTFQTGISWGSWSGVSCSLSIVELSANKFRVNGTGKQNVRGGQLLAINIGGEAQSKALKAIEKMKQLAS